MKKTFTINISGIIFHIDEDAYRKLNLYLDSVKTHFAGMEGHEEILNDIESRIAEILQTKLNEQKQVVTIADIDEVIETMGQPSQFSESDDPEEEAQAVYEAPSYKRLYRDLENRWIGGVCSGIGAYFHIDPVWIRLLFFISIWIGGAGLLVYLILWIVLPEARTTAERLEMRGEKVNISNIEKSIREEVDQLKDKLNDLKNQAKGSYKKKSEASRTVFDNLLKVFISILTIAGKALIILTGIVLTLAGLGILIAFLTGLFGWGGEIILDGHESIPYSLPDFFVVFLGSNFNLALFKVALIFFIGIPVVMLLYSGARLLFGFERIKYLGLTAFNLWIIGLIMVFYFSFKTARHYKYEDLMVRDVSLGQPVSDTIYLQMDNRFFDTYSYQYNYFHWDEIHMILIEGGSFRCMPELEIRKSESDSVSMTYYARARGRNRLLAEQRAESISYDFAQNDTAIIFQPFFDFENNDSWHGEQLDVVLYVPEGKFISLDNNMWRITGEYTYYKYRGQRHDKSKRYNKYIRITHHKDKQQTPGLMADQPSHTPDKQSNTFARGLMQVLVNPWFN